MHWFCPAVTFFSICFDFLHAFFVHLSFFTHLFTPFVSFFVYCLSLCLFSYIYYVYLLLSYRNSNKVVRALCLVRSFHPLKIKSSSKYLTRKITHRWKGGRCGACLPPCMFMGRSLTSPSPAQPRVILKTLQREAREKNSCEGEGECELGQVIHNARSSLPTFAIQVLHLMVLVVSGKGWCLRSDLH